MSFTEGREPSNRFFNNADSFAISFDAEWKKYNANAKQASIDIDENIEHWSAYGEHSLVDDIACNACEQLSYNLSEDDDKELIIALIDYSKLMMT